MTPTQDFENYPEFANSGQKSQPNDAKYAAGFIPSDVLPAEWLNWFLNGATKGVTALNTGVKSVEQEINTVLKSRSVTPDINAAGQLLVVLNKIKAEAINEAWPVGITYVQYPQQKSPQELFPKTTWVELSYDGAFFRASGGNADAFIEKSGVLSKQEEGLPNITASGAMKNVDNSVRPAIASMTGAFSSKVTNRNLGYTGARADWGGAYSGQSSDIIFTAANGETKTDGSLKTDEDGKVYGKSDHVTPENYTVRVWIRTA